MSNNFANFYNAVPYQAVFPQPFRDTELKTQEEQFPALHRWMNWKYQHTKVPALPASTAGQTKSLLQAGRKNSCTRPHYGNDLSFRSRYAYDKDIFEVFNTACKDVQFKKDENTNFSLLMYHMDPDPRPLDLLIFENIDLMELLTSQTATFGKPANLKKTTERKRPKRKSNKRAPRPMKILEPILEVPEEDMKEIAIPMDFLNKNPVNSDWIIDHIVSCG